MNDRIKPAIISRNFNEIAYKVDIVDDFVSWVHLDVMDGKFAESESWHTPQDLELLEGKVKLEVHLMIEEPETEIKEWTRVADRVLVHVEATEHLDQIISALEPHSTKIGLVLLFDTPLEKISPFLEKINFIQLMSIKKIGFHGQEFEKETLERIKNLRAMWPNGTIQVDGGMTLENASECFLAGADTLVVGSGIWSTDDHAVALQKFLKL